MAGSHPFFIGNPRGNNRVLRLERLTEDGEYKLVAVVRPGTQISVDWPLRGLRMRETPAPRVLHAARTPDGSWSVPRAISAP